MFQLQNLLTLMLCLTSYNLKILEHLINLNIQSLKGHIVKFARNMGIHLLTVILDTITKK